MCAVCFVWPCAPLLCVIPSQILRSAADTRDIALCGYKYIYNKSTQCELNVTTVHVKQKQQQQQHTKIPLCVYGSSRHSGCCEAHNWLEALCCIYVLCSYTLRRTQFKKIPTQKYLILCWNVCYPSFIRAHILQCCEDNVHQRGNYWSDQ